MAAETDGRGPWEVALSIVFHVALGLWLLAGILGDLDRPVVSGAGKVAAVAGRVAVVAFALVAFRALLIGLARLRRPRG